MILIMATFQTIYMNWIYLQELMSFSFIIQDDYDYNNYGYNSDGYDSYNNDENEYYAKYHGIKIFGNRFNYGGKCMN